MSNDKPCILEGCDKRAKGRYCSMHAERMRLHGSFDRPAPSPRGKARPDFIPKYDGACVVDGCDRASGVRGMCATHYKRWRQTGEVGGVIADRRPNKGAVCSVPECEREAKERGWCARHYQRWYKSGDKPSGIIRPMHMRLEVVGYRGMHARLMRDFGVASDHHCVDCHGPAHDWSYDNQDPDELIDPNVPGAMPYSLDPERYAPRCLLCHRRYDALFGRVTWQPEIHARSTHCLWGHEFNEANTYWRQGKYRVCRVCRRDGMRQAKARAA